MDENEEVRWNSCHNWSDADKDIARGKTYVQIDDAIDGWVNDARYFPRLFASAGIFLAVYLFLSLVIRDPIPIIGELAGGLLAAFMLWRYMAEHDSKSEIVDKRRLELKQSAGNSLFVVNDGLGMIEGYLEKMAAMDAIELCDELCNLGSVALDPLEVPEERKGVWLRDLYWMLHKQVVVPSGETKDALEKVLDLRREKKRSEKLSSRLFHLAGAGHIDLSLLASMVALDALIRSI
jgi:hypothetical protein